MADVDGVFVYIVFTDGASLHSQNSASATWVIYTPTGKVLSSGGICLWPSSNNIIEYINMVELLHDAISHGIQSLVLHIDSQLVVLQLNGVYHVRDPTLLWIFLRVRLLERQFENITYIHIPRNYNHVADSYENYVLDWHLIHRQWSIHITCTHVNINNRSS